jgi:ElaA protein
MLKWTCKKFAELTPYEVYAILQLRNEVFVVEQQCVFQDADNKDQHSYHLMCMYGEQLAAYSRLLAPGISYINEASIGRVVSFPKLRKMGVGRELMQRSISMCYELFGEISIKIGAQLYLKNFYESFGFIQCSDVYLEDEIQHIEMILLTEKSS